MVQNVIIEKILPAQTGEGRNGQWRKQKIVVRETAPIPHPDRHVITFFGDRMDALDGITAGMEVQVVWEAQVRMFTRQDNTEDWSNEAYGYQVKIM